MQVLQAELDRLKKKCEVALRVDVGATRDETNAASTLHSEWTYTGVATPKPEIPVRFNDDGSVNGEIPANVHVLFRQDIHILGGSGLCISEGHGQITMRVVGTLDDQGLMHIKIKTSGSIPVTQTCTGAIISHTGPEAWPAESDLIPPPDLVIADETGAKKAVDVVLGMRFSGSIEVIPHYETEPVALSLRKLRVGSTGLM